MKLFQGKHIKMDLGLVLAIVFASVVISGSLVFFAITLSGSGSVSSANIDQQIDKGIEKYIQRKTEEAQKQQDAQVAAQVESTKAAAKNASAVSMIEDHIYGDKNAKISLIEYSDFKCPFCRAFHVTARQIVDTYKGQVNWVYRHFPLPSHDPIASRQAVASECVAELGGNDKFWEYTDVLFESAPSDENALKDAAITLGVDGEAFADCLNSGKYDQKIKQNILDGSSAGVTGTPGNIIRNNETGDAVLVEGAQKLPVLQKVIDPMLSS